MELENRRDLARSNYRIHTDAIKENLILPELTPRQINLVYASEADVLNMALFGMTAKDWRDANPGKKGNQFWGTVKNKITRRAVWFVGYGCVMPRVARLDTRGLLHHVMIRGDNHAGRYSAMIRIPKASLTGGFCKEICHNACCGELCGSESREDGEGKGLPTRNAR